MSARAQLNLKGSSERTTATGRATKINTAAINSPRGASLEQSAGKAQ